MAAKTATPPSLKVLPVPDSLMEDASSLNIEGFDENPAYRIIFPNGSSEEAIQHGATRMRQERADIGQGPTPKAWHMMVVDADHPDTIMCFGLWFLVEAPKPGVADPIDTFKPPADANHEAFELLVNDSKQKRTDFMRKQGVGDYFFLASLATAQQCRKQGAATLMLQWGKEVAAQLRLPCFLQASAAGAPLYKKQGWEAKDTVSQDLSKWNPGVIYSNTLMLWWPDGTKPVEM